MSLSVSRWATVVPERIHLVMWGAADQARVNRPILQDMGCEVVALVDDTPDFESPFVDVPLFNGWKEFSAWIVTQNASSLGFVVAIGNPYGHVRCSLHDRLTAAGLTAVSFADPTALICRSAVIGEGLQVMPMAIIHNDAVVHRQCLVNSRALVEHDCVLEEGVEIGPGAILCGRVHVGANSWVGAGATIRPRIRIGRNSIVGAGAVVVSDVPDDVVVVGVPARPISSRSFSSTVQT